ELLWSFCLHALRSPPFVSHKCNEALTGRHQMLRTPARQGFCGKQAGQSGMQDSWDRRDSNAEIPFPGSYPQGRINASCSGLLNWRQNGGSGNSNVAIL
ncbi:hypothetical protein PWR66_15085, partial [Paraburkholderia sp. A1RO-5]|uniref:hypothetical protein n=1 Tax=unclassified Paraburkholderia TaxID=2615204 RepID=UPI003B7848A7